MYDQLERFFEQPTGEHYLLARAAVLEACGRRRPDAFAVARLADLAQRGDHAAVLRAVEQMMPAWALCPRVHYFAAESAASLRDRDEAELERFILSCCLRGLSATGDGGSDRPYQATYATDAQDWLWFAGRRPWRQELVRCGEAQCDVIYCEDGGQVWFDITQVIRCLPAVAGQAAAAFRGAGSA